jgi:CDP-4-dehydro-6-deoxyglucose reductase
MSGRILLAGDEDAVFDCADGQTVLDAAESAGWSIPYSCRKGVCTTCAGRVCAGTVTLRGGATGPADGVLLCQAVPEGEVRIAPRWVRASAPPLRKAVEATVYRLRRPAPRVSVLELRFPIGLRAPFRAGQYLRVLLDDGDSRLYSMANAPRHNDTAELHVRTEPGGRFSEQVVGGLHHGDPVRLELPFGEFTLELDGAPQRPVVLMATGTGFAPLKSMVEYKIAVRDRRPADLYWGVRDPGDLYMGALAAHWQQRHHWLRFIPVVSRPPRDWAGRTGWVQDAVLADHPDLHGHDVYACGSEAMTTAAQALLAARGGLPDAQFHADAFLTSATPLT